LTNLDNDQSRPVFLYFTTSDEKSAVKVESYENAILTNEKVCIAAKFFDCYQVDVTDLESDHPILKLIKNPKPLTVYTIYGGKVLYRTKEKPSASKIFNICSGTLKKIYRVSLEKIAKKEEKILNGLEKIAMERKRIEQSRFEKGRKISKRENLSLQKKEQELFEKENSLKEAEQKLLDLEGVLQKKKDTAKA